MKYAYERAIQLGVGFVHLNQRAWSFENLGVDTLSGVCEEVWSLYQSSLDIINGGWRANEIVLENPGTVHVLKTATARPRQHSKSACRGFSLSYFQLTLLYP
jgi:hypothetical protein